MSCQTVRKSLSAYLDQQLAEERQGEVAQHLAACRGCRMQVDELAHMRDLLRALPEVRVPETLTTNLQIIGSRELARRLARADWRAIARLWIEDTKLSIDNMMRPFALPIAGGLASALMLFTMLMPSLNFRHDFSDDIPLTFHTEARMVEMAPFGFSDDEVIVEVALDADGGITGYSVPKGTLSREMTARLGNTILFASFAPATMFGQPMPSKLRVIFRRTALVVRG
jgi:hypothetical protein